MKKQLVSSIFICLFPVLFTACVSSILRGSPPSFSKEIKVQAPGGSFLASGNSIYPSWKSSKSGNVISIISDCDPNSSATLNSLHYMVEDALSNVKTVKEENTNFQGKPAVSKKVIADLDGHAIELQSLSFKRKSCGYVSTLSGKADTLEQDLQAFIQFNSGLKFE